MKEKLEIGAIAILFGTLFFAFLFSGVANTEKYLIFGIALSAFIYTCRITLWFFIEIKKNGIAYFLFKGLSVVALFIVFGIGFVIVVSGWIPFVFAIWIALNEIFSMAIIDAIRPVFIIFTVIFAFVWYGGLIEIATP